MRLDHPVTLERVRGRAQAKSRVSKLVRLEGRGASEGDGVDAAFWSARDRHTGEVHPVSRVLKLGEERVALGLCPPRARIGLSDPNNKILMGVGEIRSVLQHI